MLFILPEGVNIENYFFLLIKCIINGKVILSRPEVIVASVNDESMWERSTCCVYISCFSRWTPSSNGHFVISLIRKYLGLDRCSRKGMRTKKESEKTSPFIVVQES